MKQGRLASSVGASGVLLGLLLLFSQLSMLAAMPRDDEVTAKFGGDYRRPLEHEPAVLDPARTNEIYATTVMNQIFDGLVQFDSHLNPIPAIAGFWEASRDSLTWTFYLRKGVKFHNRREVTAEDFVYSFSRILDPAVNSPVAALFKHIRGAEAFQTGQTSHVEGLKALDRYILQITLKEPYAPLLSLLAMAHAKVVPREAVEALGDQFGQRPVGSGPFTFVQWERNKQIVLQAFDYYYEGRAFLDQVVFKLRPRKTAEEDVRDFLNAQLEETSIPSAQADAIRKSPNYHSFLYLTRPTLHLLYIGFNTQRAPFTNPKVRQAFSYAINKEAIVREIRKRGSIVANGILPPGMPGYNPYLKSYYYNPRRAQQLLAEAGYPGGTGLPVIDIWHSSRAKTTPQELQAYKEYLADIGVKVQIHKAKDWSTFKTMLQKGELLMFRLSWTADLPDPDNFFFPILSSHSKTNRTFYQNAEVDRLLETARRETDYQQRIVIYREIEERVLRDAPWISQHHRAFENLYQPYVRGIEVNSLGAPYIPMKKVWLEKVRLRKTKHDTP